jgi:hypothetical protein
MIMIRNMAMGGDIRYTTKRGSLLASRIDKSRLSTKKLIPTQNHHDMVARR